MPEISIVLPTYNGEKYLKQSIESILGQTYTDWELIVVNDCSTDSTQEIIDFYRRKTPESEPYLIIQIKSFQSH